MLINSYRFGATYDTQAQAYITAVETADGQALETATRDAINAFVVGCKTDGIWAAFQQCGILCGARTQAGALIPLIKPSGNSNPLQQGTVNGWTYNRKTGLAGNGVNNYVDTNYIIPSGNQNNCHASIYKTTAVAGGGNPYYIGTATSEFGSIFAIGSAGAYPLGSVTAGSSAIGLSAFSRANSSSASFIRPGSSAVSISNSSSTVPSASVYLNVINNNGSPGTQWSSAPLAFYSIGTDINLGLLSTRVTDLINAINAAF